MSKMTRRFTLALLLLALFLPALTAAQTSAAPAAEEKVPLERCDVLPVMLVKIDGGEMRFLVDTGATTVLNLKSFSSGRSKQITITSWSGTAATSAREVFIPEMKIGTRTLAKLRLPAVDLAPIAAACGGRIDGILGIDLLEKTGATIDLVHHEAHFGEAPASVSDEMRQHDAAMQHCLMAFNTGNAPTLKECLDPEIVLYTPWGEFRGRDEVIRYLQQRFFSLDPHPQFQFNTKDMRLVGDAVWRGYEYKIESPTVHINGRGMMICRKVNGHWLLLNMHNSFVQPEAEAKGAGD